MNRLSLLTLLTLFLPPTFLNVSAFQSSAASQAADANGTAPNHSVWQTQGYGYILEVIDENIRFYDVTKQHCLHNKIESGEYPSRNLTVTGQSAELNWYTLHPVKLKKLPRLPELCGLSSQPEANSQGESFLAPEMFDTLWLTFAENFAFNTELGWDWHARYPTWRNKITQDMTEAALAALIRELISELGDAHAYVESDDDSFFAMHNIKWEKFRKKVSEQRLLKQHAHSTFGDLYDALNEKQSDIIASYFDDTYSPQRLNRSMLWASLPNDIGYLSIDDMSDYTEQETAEADLEEVDRSMRFIMPSLVNSKGLVIDLRWNSGGSDIVSQRILSYLIDKPLLMGSKSYRTAEGFSQPTNIIVQPAPFEHYLGPVVVLTSGITMSAAESFLLGMGGREHVTIIGEPSNGGFSDSLPKQLPNGWSFALSNERYYDHKGENYEYRGYPVAKYFEYLNKADLEAEKDSALVEAMNILQ